MPMIQATIWKVSTATKLWKDASLPRLTDVLFLEVLLWVQNSFEVDYGFVQFFNVRRRWARGTRWALVRRISGLLIVRVLRGVFIHPVRCRSVGHGEEGGR